MLDFSVASLEEIIVHKVGNKAENQDLILSNEPVRLKDETIADLLSQYFLKPFNKEIFYHFDHEAGLDSNFLYPLIKDVFDSPSSFFDHSVTIATHLYEETNHPNIKEGELYLTYMKDCRVGEEYVDAIGIFKSESKETFLKVYEKGNSLDVDYESGVNINKLDKGCVIFNLEKEEGFRVCVVDHTNKTSDIAQFWQTDFLGVRLREDQFFHTDNYMNLCKGFVEDVFTPQNDVERTDQMTMMKKSVDYFANNKEFNQSDFESSVIEEPGIIDAFQNYQSEYAEKNDVPFEQNFDISKTAVNSNKKHFKSILKLDKKFHVYVHGGHNYIERGYDDERRMNFYKLYFDEEV